MDKLRKENEKLRTDLQATKEEVEKLSKLVTYKSQDGESSCPLSPGQNKSVDFLSSQYDGIMEQLQSIKVRDRLEQPKQLSILALTIVVCSYVNYIFALIFV